MKEKWQKLPIYGKIGIVGAVVAIAILVVVKMRKKKA